MLSRLFYSRRKPIRPPAVPAARPAVEALEERSPPAGLLDLPAAPGAPAPHGPQAASGPLPGGGDLVAVVLRQMAQLRDGGELSAEPFSPDLRSEDMPPGFRNLDALDALFSE